ncbi:MAG: hypothetical protein A3E01_04480 [Gammaproteobacteria bacterium RIFCSPHIGHO2_12_FULL_63_22]|nr:MAG: hypothetical protein A3E01_04480 [Gammaproteobacteria bacterium RIFCSPHIGHO2_12_FULL_63_22]
MKPLAQRIDEHQQTQSTTGKFGSWHQDSAARCLDLVTSVIEPEIAERVVGDTKRLDWLLDSHANVETDGAGNWRVVLDWTCPETYYPYAKGRRAAIDKAIARDAIPTDQRAGE